MQKIELDVPAESGGYLMRETVRFAFFMRRRHLDLAVDANDAFVRIIDLFPPPALSMFAIETGDWFDYDSKGLKRKVRDKLIGKDQTINARVSLAGSQANIPDYAVEYFGLAIDRPLFLAGTSVLWFFVAASAFAPYRARALEISRDLSSLLGCSASYVELALEGATPRMQAAARRFVNLDISYVSGVGRDLEDKLPGVFWHNHLGPALATALGGQAQLRSILSNEAQVEEDGAGGLFVTLGAEPTRGDVNRQENIADRVALARLADQRGLLHLPRKVTYFDAENGLSSTEAQKRWHRRFVPET